MPFNLPLDLSDDELSRDWNLSPSDRTFVGRHRGDNSRLNVALQLCVLRRCGRFLERDDYAKIPVQILNFVVRQLGQRPVFLAAPPTRKQTDLAQENAIRKHLGFSPFARGARKELDKWVREQAARGMLVDELIVRSEEHLFKRNIVVPARSTIDRLVRSLASQSEADKMASIFARIPLSVNKAIDELLLVGNSRSRLEELREPSPEATAHAMNRVLRRADFLLGLKLHRVKLSGLPGVTQEVIAHHGDLVKRYDVARIRRFGTPTSHVMVLCFLLEREKALLDELVDMHHAYLLKVERGAKDKLEVQRKEVRRGLRKGIPTLMELGKNLQSAEPTDTIEAFRAEHVAEPQVSEAIAHCATFARIEDRGLIDAFLSKHSNLKQYLPNFLTLPFTGGKGMGPLVRAIKHARAFHESGAQALAKGAPVKFAKASWATAIEKTTTDKVPDFRVWELALAFESDAALRRGDLHLPRSREHIPFWNLVHSPEQWKEKKDEAYVELKLEPKPHDAIAKLRVAFDAAADAFLEGQKAKTNRFASIEGGALKLHRPDALEVSKNVKKLRAVIAAHMPPVGIEEVVTEVDRLCPFIRELTPIGSQATSIRNLYAAQIATLLAHGTNLGTAQMAQAARIPVDDLQYVSQTFFRDDTLRAANRVLVEYHHKLPLAAMYGYGGLTSCDGKRERVEQSSLLATLYPRHFGYYDRAVNMLTFMSDQHSVFNSRVISCGVREALYVLDGLLDNDTVIKSKEHTTDTHGATEQLFGLCYLLGIDFMPRFADLKDVQLYRLDRERSYEELDALMRSVDIDILVEQWDALVRVAASLRDKSAPAHVILDRLVANASDRLAKALTMLGRIVKTIHILNYLNDPIRRGRIQLQLNRGEGRHAVVNKIRFANRGAFRSADFDEIMNKVSALSVLSNALLIWNTLRITEIVEKLEATSGTPIPREDLARVSPFQHARLLVSGRYNLDKLKAPGT